MHNFSAIFSLAFPSHMLSRNQQRTDVQRAILFPSSLSVCRSGHPIDFLLTRFYSYRRANTSMAVLRFTFIIVCVLLITAFDEVQSSSAGFQITALDRSLVEVEGNGDIPTYTLQMPIGQTVTLVSQGIVMPRGRPSQPGEPDSGSWLFDDTLFQSLPNDEHHFDKTQIPVTLKALKSGGDPTHVRFVGSILGYDREYDVLVTVTDH